MTCKCACHSGSIISHVIPCCFSKLRFDETVLKNIASESVDLALSNDEIRQKRLQDELEARIKSSTHPGKGKEKLDKEDDDHLNIGAPKRQEPSQNPAQDQMQGASSLQQANNMQGSIDSDSVIDALNIIRSGRSLTDKDIRDLLKKYLGSLSPQQLQSFFGVLQRIGQVVQPAVPARTQAPPDEPAAVTKERLAMLNQKQQQLQAPKSAENVKAPPPERRIDPDEEDLTPPIRVTKKR